MTEGQGMGETDTPDQAAANTALMLDREINKRVALALCELLSPGIVSTVDSDLNNQDYWAAADKLSDLMANAIGAYMERGVQTRMHAWMGGAIDRHVAHALNSLTVVQAPDPHSTQPQMSFDFTGTASRCPSCGR